MGRGPRKFFYTWEDVSWLTGLTRRKMRQRVKTGELRPQNFRRLVSQYAVRRATLAEAFVEAFKGFVDEHAVDDGVRPDRGAAPDSPGPEDDAIAEGTDLLRSVADE